jgi:hypothetical protein
MGAENRVFIVFRRPNECFLLELIRHDLGRNFIRYDFFADDLKAVATVR